MRRQKRFIALVDKYQAVQRMRATVQDYDEKRLEMLRVASGHREKTK